MKKKEEKATIALCLISIKYTTPHKPGTKSKGILSESTQTLLLLDSSDNLWSDKQKTKAIKKITTNNNIKQNINITNFTYTIISKHGLTTYTPE